MTYIIFTHCEIQNATSLNFHFWADIDLSLDSIFIFAFAFSLSLVRRFEHRLIHFATVIGYGVSLRAGPKTQIIIIIIIIIIISLRALPPPPPDQWYSAETPAKHTIQPVNISGSTASGPGPAVRTEAPLQFVLTSALARKA